MASRWPAEIRAWPSSLVIGGRSGSSVSRSAEASASSRARRAASLLATAWRASSLAGSDQACSSMAAKRHSVRTRRANFSLAEHRSQVGHRM